MARSKLFRLEVAVLWVAFSLAAGYRVGKDLQPYEPGHAKAINRQSTLDNLTSGGRP